MLNAGIGPWVGRKAARLGRNTALVHRDERITYGELAERIERLSSALAGRGIVAGDRVAYLGNNHPSFLEALFATAHLGAIFVPLNTRLAASELRFMLEDSGATAFLFHAELRELAEASVPAAAEIRAIVIEGEPGPDQESYAALRAAALPTDASDRPVALDDPAMILYTSGTTGRPKGAVITHGNLTWNTINVFVDYGVSAGERVLLISPLFHVAALSNGALPVLLQGGTVVLHERFEPGAVLETIARERITMLSGVPTTYQLLQEHEDWDTTDLSSLQRLTCGGSAVPERTIVAYEERGLGFSSGYGMTESSPGAAAMPAEMARQKLGSSGLKHFFTDVKIVDAAGATLPAGETGEILISGPNVISEYWNRPEATAETFVDGWLRSGDLGFFDADGYLFVTDRLKDVIISGGENISSAEVEAAIMELPEVLGAALIGVPDPRWGETPIGIIELRPGRELTDTAIQEHLATRLAKYKIPRRIIFTDGFPRTASGKIRKSELRAQYGSA